MTAVRASRYPHLPLVGREAEMRVLSTCLEDLSSDSGHLVLLAGDPGIGKTRLAEEATRYADTLGIRAAWGQCFDWAGTPAYWPWIEILRDLLGSREPSDLHKRLGSNSLLLAQLFPEVSGTPPDPPVASLMNPEQVRFRLFDELTQFLKQSARDQPLLLILEDLHWADPASLLMLAFVSHELDDSAICIIGTYRDVEVRRDQPLSRALASLVRNHTTQRLILHGLDRVHIEQMVRQIAGINSPDGVARHVYMESEGNAFYATELVRLLVSRGEIAHPPSGGSWKTSVPSGVREVIGNSLDRLSRRCNEMLRVAAVIGREFDLRILDLTCGLATDDLRVALSEAIEARVLAEHGGVDRFRFSHVLTQETIYEEMSASLRFALHERVGTVTEREYASNLGPHLGDLARHFRLAPSAENLRKAVNYSVLGGDQAMEQVAWESAVGHYERGVELMEASGDVPPESLCALLLKLGHAQSRASLSRGQEKGAGSDPESWKTFVRTAMVAKEASLAEYFAAAALGSAGPSLHHSTEDARGVALMQEALGALPAGDSVLRASLLARLGRECYHQALCDPATLQYLHVNATMLPSESLRLSESAIAMARRLEDKSALVYALRARPIVIADPLDGWFEEQFRLTDEMIVQSRQLSDQTHEAWSINERIGLLFLSGDADAARQNVRRLTELASWVKMPIIDWFALMWEASNAISTGRYDDAKRLLQRGHQTWPNSLGLSCQEIILYREIGEIAGASVRAVLDSGAAGSQVWVKYSPFALIHRLQHGNERAVGEELRSLDPEVFSSRPRTPSWIRSATLFAELAVELEERTWATRLHQDLSPYFSLNIGSGFHDHTGGSVSYYLGLLAAYLERWDEAEQHFAFSLERNTQCGYRPYVAYTKYDWARMLLKHGKQRDRERGLAFLVDAGVIAQEIGMIRLQRLIAAAERASETRRRNTDSAGLSPRELEVLKLLVEGKSDRQIGDELFISRHTAMRHVSNILRKLNVESRGAAAVQAVRRGLV